jgi:hypothetical protein
MLEIFRDGFALNLQTPRLSARDMGYIRIEGASEPNESRISGIIDGIEAYRKAVWKSLVTPRHTYGVYGGNHGSEFHLLIGRSVGYAKARIPQMMHDALAQDDRFIRIESIKITHTGQKVLRADTLISSTLGVLRYGHDVPLE